MTPNPDNFRDRAYSVLRSALGPHAEFRDGQLDAIHSLVVNHSKLLVVQRTGWGKSIVYFIATRMLRDAGAGPTIIVSPLLALMRDQIRAAELMGVKATTMNSSNTLDWAAIEAKLLAGGADVLLVSPERLNNADFRERLLIPLTAKAGLFVIDEAHCISDWGHDFRPDYRRIIRILNLLPAGVPVLCTTATANDRVIDDIRAQLGENLQVSRGNLDRESLALSAYRLDTQAERLAWLAEQIPSAPGTGIIYCLTVDDTERVSAWLRMKGIDAIAYSAGTDQGRRPEIERRLRENNVKVVCATSALGMGFDKPDLAFVIHYQSPDTPVAYYQQVGRAGRSIERAYGVLFAGAEDQDIWEWFLKTSLPVQEQAVEVVGVLANKSDWVTLGALQSMVNVRQTRLESLLKVLDVDGAVESIGQKYRRTLSPWAFDRERIERVHAARLHEQQLMRDYASTTECRMKYLRDLLDDSSAEECGRCDNCRRATDAPMLDRELILEAIAFLRHQPAIIEPRKQWVWPRTSRIPTDHQLQTGRALASLNDGAYGTELLRAKHEGLMVSDEIVEASAELIRKWLPEFTGTLVPVPTFDSSRALVPNFTQRLAAALGADYAELVVKVRHTQPQKLMENSAQQFRNIDGAYQTLGAIPMGPLLLVDDVSDSRWTMVVIADLLAKAGAREIYPFAIAKTKG